MRQNFLILRFLFNSFVFPSFKGSEKIQNYSISYQVVRTFSFFLLHLFKLGEYSFRDLQR